MGLRMTTAREIGLPAVGLLAGAVEEYVQGNLRNWNFGLAFPSREAGLFVRPTSEALEASDKCLR